jgi:hypothetical protein
MDGMAVGSHDCQNDGEFGRVIGGVAVAWVEQGATATLVLGIIKCFSDKGSSAQMEGVFCLAFVDTRESPVFDGKLMP